MTTEQLIRELRASDQRKTFTLRLTDEQALHLLASYTSKLTAELETELAAWKADRKFVSEVTIRDLIEKNGELLQELAALRRDRERLDWLEDFFARNTERSVIRQQFARDLRSIGFRAAINVAMEGGRT